MLVSDVVGMVNIYIYSCFIGCCAVEFTTISCQTKVDQLLHKDLGNSLWSCRRFHLSTKTCACLAAIFDFFPWSLKIRCAAGNSVPNVRYVCFKSSHVYISIAVKIWHSTTSCFTQDAVQIAYKNGTALILDTSQRGLLRGFSKTAHFEDCSNSPTTKHEPKPLIWSTQSTKIVWQPSHRFCHSNHSLE